MSASQSAFRQYLGCSSQATADRVLWILDALMERAHRVKRPSPRPRAARKGKKAM
jgi:hypothetical protein